MAAKELSSLVDASCVDGIGAGGGGGMVGGWAGKDFSGVKGSINDGGARTGSISIKDEHS